MIKNNGLRTEKLNEFTFNGIISLGYNYSIVDSSKVIKINFLGVKYMNFSAFFSYTFLTAYTPGPNNIMCMTNAGRDGLKQTIRFIMGIYTGFLLVLIACAAFTSILYEFIPAVPGAVDLPRPGAAAGQARRGAWIPCRHRPVAARDRPRGDDRGAPA